MADALLKAKVMNDDIAAQTDSESNDVDLRLSRARQLFVSDWRHELLLAGYCYQFSAGTITAGGNVAPITGGGGSTTVDQDQPEFGFGVPTGYTLIPLRVQVACQVDLDADVEEGNIVLWADTAAAVPTDGTKTSVSPINMLHGATDVVGTAFSACTEDLTDPSISIVLAYATVQNSEVTAAGEAVVHLDLLYEPALPPHFSGPCSVYGAWGGTAAVPGIASIQYAVVPNARFNRS